MALELRDEWRRVLPHLDGLGSKGDARGRGRPGVERLDGHLPQPKRREQAPGQARQAFLGDDDLHPGFGVERVVVEGDLREPVQGHRRLATARAPQDEQRLIRGHAHGLELLGVEQRGDVERPLVA